MLYTILIIMYRIQSKYLCIVYNPKIFVINWYGTEIFWDWIVSDWIGTWDWSVWDCKVLDWIIWDWKILDWTDWDWKILDWSVWDWNVLDWSVWDWNVLDWTVRDWKVLDWTIWDWKVLDWIVSDWIGSGLKCLGLNSRDWIVGTESAGTVSGWNPLCYVTLEWVHWFS